MASTPAYANSQDGSYQRRRRTIKEVFEPSLRHPTIAMCNATAGLASKMSRNAAEVIENRVLGALLSWVSSSINKGKKVEASGDRHSRIKLLS